MQANRLTRIVDSNDSIPFDEYSFAPETFCEALMWILNNKS